MDAFTGPWGKIFSDSTAIEDDLHIAQTPPSSLILPTIYENWTRMFRKNHKYRAANYRRKSAERGLIENIGNYQQLLNTEMLSLMQEMKFDRMAVVADGGDNEERQFIIDPERIEHGDRITVEEYIRWLYELHRMGKDFKDQLFDEQRIEGRIG
ncbi:hypothetical protein BLA29_010057 [Euroglyphus maynei]|uniref:Uncharacterized protein n=1 Tax=Euroglyphus maynei TaxID=6958 RepID=A0A1Y3BPI6_EURMA|nr:hypothetical protein BLA29_010057 [Euroglyphus maynei]